MTRPDVGPRRSSSVETLLRGTRVLAIAAVLALAAGLVSALVAGDFWARHALLASLVASVIIVMISVAVIDAVLERRRRERWSILAQFVMLELVRNARLIWTGVLAQVGLLTADAARPEFVEANGRIVQDTPRLRAAVLDTIADEHRRRELHEEIAQRAVHTDEVLGRWAAVMLNADVYAEVIDHHVELATDISWLISVLDNADPPRDHGRQRRASSSPSVQIAGQVTGDDLGSSIVVITQLAEQLDRNTLDLALRIVPLEWWQARLGATVPLDRQTDGVARVPDDSGNRAGA